MKQQLLMSLLAGTLLYACCAADDCGNELYLSLRFEDDQGNNVISDSTLSIDSINIVSIYPQSEVTSEVNYVDENGNVNLYLAYDIDSIKVKVNNEIVGVYKVELIQYDDSGCCGGYKNFNLFFNSTQSCLSCYGKPVIIKL